MEDSKSDMETRTEAKADEPMAAGVAAKTGEPKPAGAAGKKESYHGFIQKIVPHQVVPNAFRGEGHQT